MAKKVKLALFDERYYSQLLELLKKFQKEVYGASTKIDIDGFIIGHHGYIYLILNEESRAIGFSSFVYNSYNGLREATLGNDYIYIDKEYRRTRAMHLISIQAGTLCQNNNIPLEHYVASDASAKFNGRMSGKKLFSTFVYEVKEVSREMDRLKSKIRIKE